ncbi:MAG: hypothetical protein EPO08_15700 [Rhodospirillaceae bacterium]|nr:MAG: hypothetical protein EPO08_15700 [Rhodospirillaceae bacterium]
MSDRRLAPVYTALAAGQIKVLSVDVFDTLLWRRVPEAIDVFLLLGRSLAACGKLAAHVSVVEFAELRRAAEKTARERKEAATGYREVTLLDIHNELPRFLFAKGFDAAAGAAAEIELESTLMICDPAVAALMAHAKAAGARVILVSDTYFSSAQVRGLLSKAQSKTQVAEGRDFDRLYVSCEAGRPKWRDLFDTIVTDAGVPPTAIHHVGDSLEADVWPCRARGMGFTHYDKWSFGARVQTVEFPKDMPERAVRLGTRGDFGLTGLRSRLFNRSPDDLPAAMVPYWSYGAATLGPVFAAFARWIVATCRREGVTCVYGMMREGRFLNRLVADTAAAVGVSLETKELWVSRRAVVRAALSPETPGLLPEFAMLSPGRTTDEVLAAMGLTNADLAAAGIGAFDITRDDALVSLCRTIGGSSPLLAKTVAVAAENRRNLMAGIGRVLDVKAARPAVVMDLGYTATIQTALQAILGWEKSPLRLMGLYLALNARAKDNVRANTDLRAFLNEDGFAGPMGELLSRVPFVLEHACMCREGSLSAFDSAGNPVLLPNLREESQLAQMEALQAGIITGVAAVNGLMGSLEQTPADDPLLKAQIAAIITASHLHPTPQEAGTIGAWKHEAKIDFTGAFKLTDLSFDGPSLEYRGWPALQDMGLDQVYWPSAAFVAADPFIADVYAGGIRHAYQPEHLTAGPVLGRVMVCPDSGAGYDERLQGTIPIAVNAFGRADLQAAIKAVGPETYHRLRFTWPGARAIIGIDKFTVTYVGDGQRLSREVADAAHWQKAQAIGSGLVQAESGAVWEMTLEAPPAWPHGMEISLRLKYLRLDPLFGGRKT